MTGLNQQLSQAQAIFQNESPNTSSLQKSQANENQSLFTNNKEAILNIQALETMTRQGTSLPDVVIEIVQTDSLNNTYDEELVMPQSLLEDSYRQFPNLTGETFKIDDGDETDNISEDTNKTNNSCCESAFSLQEENSSKLDETLFLLKELQTAVLRIEETIQNN